MTRDRLPFTLKLYRASTRLAAPFAGMVLKRRLKRDKEDPTRVAERRGIASKRRPRGPLVWMHGASVGEILSVMPLLDRIRASGFAILLTSGTVTAARLAERRLPEGVLHQFAPLDSPVFVQRFLDYWQPGLVLLAESELWPNIITEGARRGVPLVLINGRLSKRSFDRWKMFGRTAAALLSNIDLCLAQENDDARRLAQLGAPRVFTTGNLKFDVPPPPADAMALSVLKRATRGRSIVLAASTHKGEETVVLEAHRRLRRAMPNLLTIIAPRHPERGRAVAGEAEEAGLLAVLRTRAHQPDSGTEIYVADTIGELGLFYRLAPIVFVGGSLVKHGGQNPIEPAKLDCAILHGPYVSNFSMIYAELNRARGAATVTDVDSLTTSMELLLYDPNLVSQMAETAHATVLRLGGALERTFTALEPYLVQLRLSN
ncbi:MAG TPA: 3-deoxy-D-manno-octulosonic acid transferase [Xanthobacteraceae bacterium]